MEVVDRDLKSLFTTRSHGLDHILTPLTFIFAIFRHTNDTINSQIFRGPKDSAQLLAIDGPYSTRSPTGALLGDIIRSRYLRVQLSLSCSFLWARLEPNIVSELFS